MKAFYVLLGILSFVCGVLCLMNPFGSFLALGVLVSVFMLLVGIYFIMIFIQGRNNRLATMNKPATGIAGLLLGIALIVLSILSLAVPSIEEGLDMVILIVVAVFMIISGILSVFNGFSLNKQGLPGCPFYVIFGVICAIAGIYGLIHMAVFGESLGLVLGILMLIYGIDLIGMAFVDPDMQ